MQATQMIDVGYMAKANARNSQILIGSNINRAREAQSNLITSTTNVVRRTQITFDNIQKDTYLKNGGLMTIGLATIGTAFDQKG